MCLKQGRGLFESGSGVFCLFSRIKSGPETSLKVAAAFAVPGRQESQGPSATRRRTLTGGQPWFHLDSPACPTELSPETCCSHQTAKDRCGSKQSCCFAVKESNGSGSASDEGNQLEGCGCLVRTAPHLQMQTSPPTILWER